MKVEQIYTGCLAHGAYYIESGGEAAIIDPLREVQPYIDMVRSRGAKIKYVFETHFHADFVSGHIDLAKKTGAEIVYGPTTMQTGFDALIAKDGQEFKLGNATIRLIHTPGHTMESSCYLLIDEKGKPTSLFTGDTLFIGDVGRPDLAQKVIEELTQEKLAGHLFESLRNKILPLDDDIIIYPGHGAGSACGKKMSSETTDTLGNQKKTNYALRLDLSKEEFIQEVLAGLTPPPGYFPQNVLMNIQGYDSIDKVLEKGSKALNLREFEFLIDEMDPVIIDSRDAQLFGKGFVPGSYNIGIDGNFASWVGTLIPDIKQPILLVVDGDRIEEVVTRLARVGFDNPLGYLKGGFETWKKGKKKMDTIDSISIDELVTRMKAGKIHLLDVRRASEYESEHIVGAENAPLDYINSSISLIDQKETYYVICRTGYRSMAFTSILRKKGFHNLIDVKGGITEAKASGKFKFTEYVAPSTLL